MKHVMVHPAWFLQWSLAFGTTWSIETNTQSQDWCERDVSYLLCCSLNNFPLPLAKICVSAWTGPIFVFLESEIKVLLFRAKYKLVKESIQENYDSSKPKVVYSHFWSILLVAISSGQDRTTPISFLSSHLGILIYNLF